MINITKSTLPETRVRYKDIEIQQKVKEDFFVLCYLCEEYTPIHFEIDHFYPQKQFPHLINDWDNLFFICEKCNKMRPKDINTDAQSEVLNNCMDDVEQTISLEYDKTRNKVNIITQEESVKTKNTISLLNKIYNGIGTKTPVPIFRREEIKKSIDDFEKLLEKNIKSKGLFTNSIRKRISKQTKSEKSTYVSFKRSIIRRNPELFEQYKDSFD